MPGFLNILVLALYPSATIGANFTEQWCSFKAAPQHDGSFYWSKPLIGLGEDDYLYLLKRLVASRGSPKLTTHSLLAAYVSYNAWWAFDV